jgi:C-methyltransferase
VSDANTPPQKDPRAIQQMFDGVRTSAILRSAVELGVFTELVDGPKHAEVMAERINAPVRSTKILLRALVALGILKEQGKKFALTYNAKVHLVPGKSTYLGELAHIVCSPIMWSGFGKLTEAIRNDGTVLTQHAETPENPFWEQFARSSRVLSLRVAKKIDKALKEWMADKPKLRILDIAAGSGSLGYTLLQRNPNAELTIVEWPNVIPEAKHMAERLGIDPARVRFIEGSAMHVDYQGPYDLVVCSHLYHHLEKATCKQLTKRIARELAPGGRVVLNEFVGNEATPNSALFSITMLAWTRGGDAYGIQQYEDWYADAGIDPLWTEPAGTLQSTLIIGQKRVEGVSTPHVTNKELMRRFYSMWQGTSRIAVEDVCAQRYKDHMPHPGPTGIEGVRGAVEMFRVAFPDSSCQIDMVRGNDDWVTGASTFRGTHTGQLMGIAPTGRRVEFKTVDTVRISRGRIAEIWHLEDAMSMFIQLGVVPPPG